MSAIIKKDQDIDFSKNHQSLESILSLANYDFNTLNKQLATMLNYNGSNEELEQEIKNNQDTIQSSIDEFFGKNDKEEEQSQEEDDQESTTQAVPAQKEVEVKTAKASLSKNVQKLDSSKVTIKSTTIKDESGQLLAANAKATDKTKYEYTISSQEVITEAKKQQMKAKPLMQDGEFLGICRKSTNPSRWLLQSSNKTS